MTIVLLAVLAVIGLIPLAGHLNEMWPLKLLLVLFLIGAFVQTVCFLTGDMEDKNDERKENQHPV